jgi:hypothetical protein
MPRKKKTISVPIPKVKERGVMPKPTRAIPDPKKAADKAACRRKVTAEEDEESGQA